MKTHFRTYFYMYLAVLIALLGFVLRAAYLRQSHPYIDEYFTILAARQVQNHGYPLLPSGLFYSHGLLYTYLIAFLGGLMSVLGGDYSPQSADMIFRVPNLLISVGAMVVVFDVSRRLFGIPAGLFAMALIVVYPHGIVWGARVRMYTLLYLLVPLLVYVFFRLATDLSNQRRFVTAVVVLGVALFVHNWVVLLVPTLLVGVFLIAWQNNWKAIGGWEQWLPWLGVMAGLIVLSLYVQSLWLPTEFTASQNSGVEGVISALVKRLDFAGDNVEFFNHFLTGNLFNLLIVVGVLMAGLAFPWLFTRATSDEIIRQRFWSMSFLYIVFLGTVAEFVLLLEPSLKQPRYASPLLVLAFIIWGGWLTLGLSLIWTRWQLSAALRTLLVVLLTLLLVVWFGILSVQQVPRLFFEGLPAVGYERAFQYIQQKAAPDDPVLSPLPAAGNLYLPNPQYFIAQSATNTFVHANTQGVLADRWVGVPWLKTPQQFKEILQTYPVTWLAIDQSSLQSQFDGTWRQLLQRNAHQVWSEDGVTVFRAEGLQYDLPTEPATSLDVLMADKLRLTGYSHELLPAGVRLVLFWQVLAPLEADYTTFVHLRNGDGQTMAQVDVQPLAGEYPTSRWQAGETIVDELLVPLPIELTPESYRLLLGLYRWDTLERLPVQDDSSGENAIELRPIEIEAE